MIYATPSVSRELFHFKSRMFFEQRKHLISSSTTVSINSLHFTPLGPCPTEESLVFVDPDALCISDGVSKVSIEVVILIVTDVV